MFLRNRASGPVCQLVASVGHMLFGQVRQGGGTGGEVYRLRLHLVNFLLLLPLPVAVHLVFLSGVTAGRSGSCN